MKTKRTPYFRLEWTDSNNPNGWIEPTTYCQLKCPGCYRGLDKEMHRPVHIPLNKVLKDIESLIAQRNIHTLSIAGGEPLMYPHLQEVIQYAQGKNLRTVIYTNGIGLNREILQQLRDSGLTQAVIHIDKFQHRTPNDSDEELFELRRKYCELFREIKGVNLGFIQPLCREWLGDVMSLTDFYTINRDVVNLVVFTLYTPIGGEYEKRYTMNTNITMADVMELLEELKVYKPSSYLPGTIDKDEPSWAFSYSIGTKDSIYGFIDKKVIAQIQKRYFSKHNRYLFISRNNSVKFSGLFKLSFYRSMFGILLNSLANYSKSKKGLYFQTYLVIRGPHKKGDQWDLCDGCPDAIIHNNKLVPSCLLEELKISPHINLKPIAL